MAKKKAAEKSLPDEIRCRRNDGRKWRCPRRVVDGKKVCDLHYDQAQRRGDNKSKAASSSKMSLSETVEKAVRIAGLKTGDKLLELTREYLKFQVEAKKKKNEEVEETMVLPIGVMTISKWSPDTASASIAIASSSSNGHTIRTFRSKNLEPIDKLV